MRLVVAILAGLALPASAPTAEACSCGCNPDAAASLRANPVLFRGRMIAVANTGHERVYQFAVTAIYRGKIPPRVSIRTNQGSAACGANFEPNVEVLIGAYERGGGLRTSLCTQICMGARMSEIERLLAACKPGEACPP